MFLVDKCEHTVGDRRCCECWVGFPQKCQCQGLIHCQFVKENWEGDKTLVYSCDACGEQYKFPVYRNPKARHKHKWKRTKGA